MAMSRGIMSDSRGSIDTIGLLSMEYSRELRKYHPEEVRTALTRLISKYGDGFTNEAAEAFRCGNLHFISKSAFDIERVILNNRPSGRSRRPNGDPWASLEPLGDSFIPRAVFRTPPPPPPCPSGIHENSTTNKLLLLL